MNNPKMTTYAHYHPARQLRMIREALTGTRATVTDRLDRKLGTIRTVSPTFGGKATGRFTPAERAAIRSKLDAGGIIYTETETGFTSVRVRAFRVDSEAAMEACMKQWSEDDGRAVA